MSARRVVVTLLLAFLVPHLPSALVDILAVIAAVYGAYRYSVNTRMARQRELDWTRQALARAQSRIADLERDLEVLAAEIEANRKSTRGSAPSLKALFAAGDRALAAWTKTLKGYTGPLLEEHQSAEEMIAILADMLKCANANREHTIALVLILVAERAQVHRTWDGLGDPLYGRVGLSPGCPDFVLKAARTAHRKHWHPDGRPAHEKQGAETKFKECEAVFDEIELLRQT